MLKYQKRDFDCWIPGWCLREEVYLRLHDEFSHDGLLNWYEDTVTTLITTPYPEIMNVSYQYLRKFVWVNSFEVLLFQSVLFCVPSLLHLCMTCQRLEQICWRSMPFGVSETLCHYFEIYEIMNLGSQVSRVQFLSMVSLDASRLLCPKYIVFCSILLTVFMFLLVNIRYKH